ncbi:sulfurtransferase TusA family protein [Rossellomorea aquimaris]|uniref:sulfurtransferase TusA family protein n=1 Tax=Rossellomorea aquimaris TaxID=189382 RepID=UPI001CD565C8|nr:sulfurtransferase TusA family protein [Rossellomorea aquimaris]MCA1053906.1 sulfurtransferase TusA family protein [Rossellomorea aquimaris]
MNIEANFVLDAKGLACPMPIVKTKKAMKDLDGGHVIEIQATDKGSKADLQAWAKSSGHDYLGTLEEGDVLKHFIRKSSGEDTVERKHEAVTNNEELLGELADENTLVLDVREKAEFAFKHIPGAVSIPLGELEARSEELAKDKNIYVVCRTGNRSDMAAQLLTDKGFENVINVVPGMSEWSGSTESDV